MEQKFYPDIEFSRKKRRTYFTLLFLGVVLIGGLAVAFYIMGQTLVALIVAAFVLLALSTIPSALSNYPVKNNALIEIEGKSAKFYGSEVIKAVDMVAISVCIEVPLVSRLKAENAAYLKELASKKPTEPVLGTCDVLYTNAKGKQITKYTIVSDCIGALEALIAIGVRKYRIVYSMKKLTENATYVLQGAPKGEESVDASELSEKDKLAQLL